MEGIYKIENIINGKLYIGSSVNIDKRIKRHKNDLIKNKHINCYLQREFNKYGIHSYIF
jgi:group I intron endonuclease